MHLINTPTVPQDVELLSPVPVQIDHKFSEVKILLTLFGDAVSVHLNRGEPFAKQHHPLQKTLHLAYQVRLQRSR